MLRQIKDWARAVKRDVVAIWLAAHDSRTPWYAKALALFVAAYALSPIDLIPDFIPVIGYLDDLIIVPLGIWLIVRLIPPELMAEYRRAALAVVKRPRNYLTATIFILIWIACAGAAARFLYLYFSA